MTVLITGATGAFGRIFSSWMETHTDEAVYRSGRTHAPGDNYIPCDVELHDEIQSLLRDVRPTRVFHLAASFSEDYSQSYAVNALSARHILDTLVAEQISARVVLFGSAAEYGVVSAGENPVSEDQPLRPVSTYGLTKAMQSQLAYQYANRYGSNVVVARLFNLLIPGLSKELLVGRLEQLILRLKRGEIQHIELGNLEAERDYVGGGEAIRLVNTIADHGVPGEAYNVGSGRPTTVREIVDEVVRSSGIDRRVVRSNAAQVQGGRAGYDVPTIYSDMSKTSALCPTR